MSTTHQLIVNASVQEVAVDYDDTPLLYALRDDLALKSTKFGCGSGECGACMVLLDGRAAKACQVAVWEAVGKAITTVEGLGTLEHPHPLQQALIDFQAGQCGYCLPGIIMSAAELMASDPAPSRDKIAAKLAANLCRCGAHGRILSAIEAACRKGVRGGAS